MVTVLKATARRVLGERVVRWARLRAVSVRTTTYGAGLVLRGFASRGSAESSSQPFVREAYEDHYGDDLDRHRSPGGRPAVVGRRIVEVSKAEVDAGHLAAHLRHLQPILAGLASPTILEVGSGYGRTLLPLARAIGSGSAFGIEPTLAGPLLARRYANERPDEIELVARLAGAVARGPGATVAIAGADGRSLPFADDAVDVSYTNLVLEQIPHVDDVRRVLTEMGRVTRTACAFLEPWDEAQSRMGRAHLRAVGYLACETSVLRDLGFGDVRVHELAFHHNPRFRVAYVTATPPT